MSKTYTGRPTLANTRGRGIRGRQNTVNNTQKSGDKMDPSGFDGRPPGYAGRGYRGRGRGGDGQMNDLGEESGPGSQQQENEPERMQRRDAYTVIAPNMKKKQAIEQQAQKETDMYNRYKQQRQLGHVSYVGTVGGGEITSPGTVGRGAVGRGVVWRGGRGGNAVRPPLTNTNVHRRSQEYRAKQRQDEDKKLNEMKSQQRQKSEVNKQRDKDRNTSLRDDHRAKNSAFLDRLEQQNRQHKTQQVLSSSTAANYPQSNFAASSSYNNQPPSPVFNQSQYEFEDEETSRSIDDTSDVMSRLAIGQQPLELLVNQFPGMDVGYLEGLLFQFNGNIDQVRDVLT